VRATACRVDGALSVGAEQAYHTRSLLPQLRFICSDPTHLDDDRAA
jgi:hypothetical protein